MVCPCTKAMVTSNNINQGNLSLLEVPEAYDRSASIPDNVDRGSIIFILLVCFQQRARPLKQGLPLWSAMLGVPYIGFKRRVSAQVIGVNATRPFTETMPQQRP